MLFTRKAVVGSGISVPPRPRSDSGEVAVDNTQPIPIGISSVPIKLLFSTELYIVVRR